MGRGVVGQKAGAEQQGEGRSQVEGQVLDAVRRATRSHHQRLERRLSPHAISRSPRAYGDVLAALYGFYAPIEARLAAVSIPLDMTARQKVPALRTDLLLLGWSAPQVHALPRCVALPALQGVPEALGSAYVVEGATLGGRIIAREVRARLGITADNGGRFFAGYGRVTGDRWRQFLETLVSAVSAADQERAALAARATFAAFEWWLEQRSVLE